MANPRNRAKNAAVTRPVRFARKSDGLCAVVCRPQAQQRVVNVARRSGLVRMAFATRAAVSEFGDIGVVLRPSFGTRGFAARLALIGGSAQQAAPAVVVIRRGRACVGIVAVRRPIPACCRVAKLNAPFAADARRRP